MLEVIHFLAHTPTGSRTLSLTRSTASLVLIALTFTSITARQTQAKQFNIFSQNADATCDEQFETLANSLKPGDELVLHGGVYSQSCRRAISVSGTPNNPITIRAAHNETPVLTRPADNIDTQNNIEFVDCQHLVVSGLSFSGGSIGVRFMGTTTDVRFEHNRIFNTGNNAFAAHSGNSTRLVILNNEIFDTGNSQGNTEGEGLYLGCNDDTCRVTDSLIANNYIHDLKATSKGGNDGIELKVGSGGNTIRANVIYNTLSGTAYPCIFAHGGGEKINLIEDNFLSHCGEALQVVRDAVVQNNIIVNSQTTGILATYHEQAGHPANLTIVNNTVYSHPTCFTGRFRQSSDIVIANNAFFCEGTQAMSVRNGDQVRFSSNAVSGNLNGLSLDHPGLLNTTVAGDHFIDVDKYNFQLKSSSFLTKAGLPIGELASIMPPIGSVKSNNRESNSAMSHLATQTRTRIGAFANTPLVAAAKFLDADQDGIINRHDNCLLVANAAQQDSDADGFGNHCDPDLNNDLTVDGLDIALFIDALNNNNNLIGDLDSDGKIDFIDFEWFKRYARLPPGPSGIKTNR